ncbi:MAG: GNAT family N-acetyltransferase [Bacteroides sp.]|nr:GNAT family N-acetyltransferase [Bacteroides sp.]
MMRVVEVTEYSMSVQQSVTALLHQLTTSPFVFDEVAFRALLADAGSHLFLLLHADEVVGMLTIGSYCSPTGKKAWVEDVVVDKAYRGHGYSKLLLEHAIRYVRSHQIPLLMLTSNPKRVEANHLYRSQGFEQKMTNVYRMKMNPNKKTHE